MPSRRGGSGCRTSDRARVCSRRGEFVLTPHEREDYAVYGFWLQVLTVLLLLGLWFVCL